MTWRQRALAAEARVKLLEPELARYIVAAAPEDWKGYNPEDPADLAIIMADWARPEDAA